MTRTAISPRLAIRTFLNMREEMIVLKEQALPSGRACMDYDKAEALFFLAWVLILVLVLILALLQHDASAGLFGGLFLFLLARIHGLIAPVIGHLNVLFCSLGVATFGIGFSAVDQVHISHGIIVILALVHGRLQHLHAFFNPRAVNTLDLLANLGAFEW